MVLEDKIQNLYDEVHDRHQHFTVRDAQMLHDTLSRSNGRRVSANVLAHRFKISATLIMVLKEKYKS